MIVDVSHCRSCGSGTHSDDRYCQECGTFLDDIIGLPGEIVTAADPSDFLVRLSPRSAQSVVTLPVVAALIVLAVLIPILVYAVSNSCQAISLGYLEGESAQQLAQGHPERALAILDRVALTHRLTPSQRQLHNSAYFLLSDQMISTSRYDAALPLLSHITPDFAQYDQVKERAQVCRDYLAQPHVMLKTAAAAKQHTNTKSRTAKIATYIEPSNATVTLPLEDSAKEPIATAPPLAKETTATTRKSSDRIATAPTKQPSSTVPLQATVNSGASTDYKKSSTTPIVVPSSGTTTDNDKPALNVGLIPKYAGNDVARYNQLLASYFSSKHAASKEPPSINEWVHAGRPKF